MKRAAFILAMGVLCVGVCSGAFAQTAAPAMKQDAKPMAAAKPTASALVGTWKLNTTKSVYPAGTMPKDLTRTITMDGDNVKYSFEGTGADGAAVKYGWTAKYDGNFYDMSGTGTPFGADKISIKMENSHQYGATLQKGGKTVGTATVQVSHDGKTTTVWGKGTGPDGKPMKNTQVFDKQ
jgi:hypothetical protein